jgi:hypothetical protein
MDDPGHERSGVRKKKEYFPWRRGNPDKTIAPTAKAKYILPLLYYGIPDFPTAEFFHDRWEKSSAIWLDDD